MKILLALTAAALLGSALHAPRANCFACVAAPCTSSAQCADGCVCAGRVVGTCVPGR